MKKRTVAWLLALCLLVGLSPLTAQAEAGDWDPTTSAAAIKGTIETGLSSTASTTKYLGEGDIQLKTMPTFASGNASYNAMAYCGVTAVSSNPKVADVKENGIGIGKWDGGDWDGEDALQVTVTPNSVGTTVVTITFYYTYSQSANPFANTGAKWFKGQMRYTVTVKDPNTKPAGPTEADAKRFRNYVNTTSSSKGAVYLWCEVNLNDHGAWFDYLTDVENGYSFGEVVKNDGRNKNAPVSSYPWMCLMTVDHTAYLEAYNEELGDRVGTHYLKYTKASTTEIAWFYGDNGWKYQASNAPVYIDVVHEDTRERFTVTYTDGVENEEIFADQVYTGLLSGTKTPAFDGTPKRDGYVFKGWNPAVADTVTANATYTAVWAEDNSDSSDNSDGSNDNSDTSDSNDNNDSSNSSTADDDGKNPNTGYAGNMLLWIALLFVSGGITVGMTAVSKKKAQNR